MDVPPRGFQEEVPMPNSARLACGCCVFLVFAVIPSSAEEDIKPKFVLQKSRIFGLSISPDGKMLAVGSEDDRVTLFDLGKEIRFLGGLATS
jgi:WD40 repeat protein